MATVEVFDPPMCCSTGVCGPSVDPALAAFAADLGWLAEQGAVVERHNLSQEPKAFADEQLVRELLAERGDEALPAVVVDGALRSSGRYPSRAELAAWALGTDAAAGLDAATAELVAIGAAIGANCEPCLRYHYDQARRLGVAPGMMAEAVRVAQTVKDTPARSMSDLAAKLLGAEVTAAQPAVAGPSASTAAVPATGGGCCGGEAAGSEAPAAEAAPAATSGCCGGEASESEVTLVTTASGVSGSSGCCG
ncbi:MAG: arsenite efflux transporter metallochaperone ArsD [Acidimicrobiales bacterium]